MASVAGLRKNFVSFSLAYCCTMLLIWGCSVCSEMFSCPFVSLVPHDVALVLKGLVLEREIVCSAL